MEPFRAPCVDKVVLHIVRLGLDDKAEYSLESGAVRIGSSNRRLLIEQYEKAMLKERKGLGGRSYREEIRRYVKEFRRLIVKE